MRRDVWDVLAAITVALIGLALVVWVTMEDRR